MNGKSKKITNQDIQVTNKDPHTQTENLGTNMDSQPGTKLKYGQPASGTIRENKPEQRNQPGQTAG